MGRPESILLERQTIKRCRRFKDIRELSLVLRNCLRRSRLEASFEVNAKQFGNDFLELGMIRTRKEVGQANVA